jgi:predicted ribosome quality control (RQC) complex YloA/Tae2 family protein
VLTDWLIVRRLAAELDRTLRGSRIRQAGVTAQGHFGLLFARNALLFDAFGATPIVRLETHLALAPAPGWPRAFAAALEGLRVDSVRARRGDRLVALDCSSRSRFGVSSGYRLVAELTPRFGNLVLLKDDTVVSAAKEFTAGAKTQRTTVAGEPYEPPPLPPAPAGGDPAATFAALAQADSAEARADASRALRCAVPLLPRLVADSLVAEFATLGAQPAAALASALARAQAIVDAASGEPAAASGEPDAAGDIFVYSDGARIVQLHVVPLAQFAALTLRRERELVPLLGAIFGGEAHDREAQAFAARRAQLRKRIEGRRAALTAERGKLERERDDAAARDRLREAGDLIYANLAEIPAGATTFVPASNPEVTIELDPALDAKANAAAIFKRYKKATAKLARVSERLEALARDQAYADDLAWELDRVEPDTLADLAESLDRLERRRAPVAASKPQPRRALEVALGGDARVYVGRSPRNNAELTFRVARPDDLWFHARATPGAHVLLRIDSQRAPSESELVAAAQLAAFHSKGRAAEKVAVDYTQRKYVRRRQGAPPGLVWYTNARTLFVAPKSQ